MNYKRWLLLAVFLFGAGLVLGSTIPIGTTGLLSDELAAVQDMVESLKPLPQSSVLAIIFIKNAGALLFSLVLSPFFCLIPIIALLFNGWLLGFVATRVIQEQSLAYLLAGLLPHGIFELPAFIIGEAVALSFGSTVLLALFKKRNRNQLRLRLRQNLKYFTVAILLLLPAAVMETYVTPLLLG